MELELVRGEQFPIEFEITNDNGNPIAISELQDITFVVREFPEEESPILTKKTLINKDIKGDNGVYSLNINEEDTKDLDFGTYGCEIKVETTSGIIKKEVGTLIITKEYSMGYQNED